MGFYTTFKRNKRDIKQNIMVDGCDFILYENIAGFYNKALIYQNKNNKKHFVLMSYNTIVAEIKNNKFIVYGYYSATTAKHLKEFLHKFNISAGGKKQLLEIANKWKNKKDFIIYWYNGGGKNDKIYR